MYFYGRHRGLGDDPSDPNTQGDYGFEDGASGAGDGYVPPYLVSGPVTSGGGDGFVPVHIPLATTPMGVGPPSVRTDPPMLVNYTPGIPFAGTNTPTGVALSQAFKNPDGSPTYDGTPYSATDLLNPYNLQHLFGGLLTTISGGVKPGAPGYGVPAGSASAPSTIGGVKTSTLALAAGVALIAYVALGRKS